MAGGDELRAELARRQADDQAATQEQRRLDGVRREWQRDEEGVKRELHAMADLTVEALANHAPTERLAVEPPPQGLSKLWRSQQHVDGGKVQLSYHESRVLCPDGTIISPGFSTSYSTREPHYSTLRDWIDRQIVESRTEQSGEDSTVDHSIPAFRPSPPGAVINLQERHLGILRGRLDSAKQSIVRLLGQLLYERGVSL